jgi:Raf kinase inhibitor-like YbhB/YbcL family protein
MQPCYRNQNFYKLDIWKRGAEDERIRFGITLSHSIITESTMSSGRFPHRAARALAVSGCASLLALTAACGAGHPAAKQASAPAPAGVVLAADARDTHHVPGPNPYQYLPRVPSFDVDSTTVRNGRPLPAAQQSGVFGAPGGQDISPELSWSGFPKATKSFVVSMYDPQAPTGSGFWHWIVADIPAGTTSLPLNAGAPNGTALPSGALELGGDSGMHRYIGGAPPKGSGLHYYYITITALDVPKSGIGADASGAFLGFNIAGHTIARATIICPTELK